MRNLSRAYVSLSTTKGKSDSSRARFRPTCIDREIDLTNPRTSFGFLVDDNHPPVSNGVPPCAAHYFRYTHSVISKAQKPYRALKVVF
jgi:hypothetical protein